MYTLLQIIAIRFFVNHIKQRLRAEPASAMRTDSAMCVRGFLVADLDRMLTARTSRRFSHELRVAAFLQRDEPENGLDKRTSQLLRPFLT